MKSSKKRIGEKIAARRKEKGFHTQNDLALVLGANRELSPKHPRALIAKWESGAQLPSGRRREWLKGVLDVSESFFADEPPAPPKPEPYVLSPDEMAELKKLIKNEQEKDSLRKQIRELNAEIVKLKADHLLAASAATKDLSPLQRKLFLALPRISDEVALEILSAFPELVDLAADESESKG